MSDADLEKIRKARLQQLQQQQGQSGGAGGGEGGAGEEEQRKQQEAEQRANILNQILDPEAADRLGRIRLVKESRATEIENRLISMARSGQLRQKVTEAQLKEMLNAVSEQREAQEAKINVVRKSKGGWDDDDDDLLDL